MIAVSCLPISIGFPAKMELQRFKITAVGAGQALLALPAHGETRICGAANVTVTYQQEEHAELACSAAQKATALFNDCSIPSFSNPVRVDVVEDLIADCLGLSHCDKDFIGALSPAVMQDRGAPCPVEGCLARVEYITYAIEERTAELYGSSPVDQNQSRTDRVG